MLLQSDCESIDFADANHSAMQNDTHRSQSNKQGRNSQIILLYFVMF